MSGRPDDRPVSEGTTGYPAIGLVNQPTAALVRGGRTIDPRIRPTRSRLPGGRDLQRQVAGVRRAVQSDPIALTVTVRADASPAVPYNVRRGRTSPAPPVSI